MPVLSKLMALCKRKEKTNKTNNKTLMNNPKKRSLGPTKAFPEACCHRQMSDEIRGVTMYLPECKDRALDMRYTKLGESLRTELLS